MARLLRDLSLVLVISGALLLADAAATLLWQEPLSALIALVKQGGLDERFLSYQRAPLSHLDLEALANIKQARQRVAFDQTAGHGHQQRPGQIGGGFV